MPLAQKNTGERSMSRVRSTVKLLVLGREAGDHPRHHNRGGDERLGDRHEGGDEDQVEDRAGDLPRVVRFALGQVGGEGGNKGAAHGSAGKQLEDEVGDAEGGKVGVEVRSGAERGAQDHVADQTQKAAGQEVSGQDEGGSLTLRAIPTVAAAEAAVLFLRRRAPYLSPITPEG